MTDDIRPEPQFGRLGEHSRWMFTLTIILVNLLFLQGCSAFSKHHGINYGQGACPTLEADQLSDGYLALQDGKTLKCQIKPYVSNMSCQRITDKTNADSVICVAPEGTLFLLFDEKGVLEKHHTEMKQRN